MNNVIFILIDSVFSECLGTLRTEVSSTPFIDSLAEESFFAKNVYSFAPYTDAATIGLYCGMPTLEALGYFFGINLAESNHFRLFAENGYETYGLYYPYYLVSNKTKKSIDHVIYTGGFKYSSVWGGKLEYYSNIQKERALNETEYRLIEKCLDMTFECWRTFYSDLKSDPTSAVIVKGLYTEEIPASGEAGLLAEYEKYSKAKREYIDNVLALGMDHPLAFVNEFDYGKKQDIDFYKRIFDGNKKFLSRVQRVNCRKNLKNNRLRLGKAIKSAMALAGLGDRQRARYIQNYGMLLAGNNMLERRALNSRNWQEIASLNKQVEVLMETLSDRGSDKPFYASLHVLEPHHNLSYFSFDCFDEEKIREEFEYLSPVVENCGKKFKGNLLYQLSLRYVDLCIKRLYEKLEERGLLETTTIALVSDHGTSYVFDPVRTKVVNTFHKENYNVPCLIWQKNLPESMKRMVPGLFTSEDILPTLGGISNLKVPEHFQGKRMYEEPDGRAYVITEYMGPGVPDMLTKEVWISIRTSRYVIAYKNPINEPLHTEAPCVIYDLEHDPNELDNLSRRIAIRENAELVRLADLVKQRYEVIRDHTSGLIRDLDTLDI